MAEEDKKEEAQTEGTEGAEGEGGEEQEGGKGKKKIIVIAAISLLFLIAAGVGFFFLGGSKEEEEAVVEEPIEPVEEQSFFYEMPDMTVNLAASGSRFLRLKAVLEVTQEADLAELQTIEPRLLDDFQAYLRELRPEDLKGSAGSYRLRHDLLLRANQASQPVIITRVLFKEFLVQ